jgi:hypothetical protein
VGKKEIKQNKKTRQTPVYFLKQDMSFILLQYVPVPVLKNLGKIAIFLQFVFDFVFIQNLHCFASLLALFFKCSKQQTKKIVKSPHHNYSQPIPIKKSELILKNASTPPTPLKSSDDPFDPRHRRLVEMFRFVFKKLKKYYLI